MKNIQRAIAFMACGLLFASVSWAKAQGNSLLVDPAKVQAIQERMLKDPGIMAIILSLQNDPDMQEVLNDPAIMAELQDGKIDRLVNDPRFVKLLTKPQVKEVEQQMH